MLQPRRSAFEALRRIARPHARRHASTDPPGTPSGHASSAGQHSATHHPPHPEPVNEPLGRGFFIALTIIPLSLAVYKFSRSSTAADGIEVPPLLTRIINSYGSYKETWRARNALHTQMAEQAAHDRNLFQSSPGSPMVDLKFPEDCFDRIFNTGSPYNVPAGQGGANLDAVIRHYEERNREIRAKQMEKLNGRK